MISKPPPFQLGLWRPYLATLLVLVGHVIVGIVVQTVLRPRDVQPIAADEQAQRLGLHALAVLPEIHGRFHADVVVERVVRKAIEAVIGRVPIM